MSESLKFFINFFFFKKKKDKPIDILKFLIGFNEKF
jgi:hypothetical protein